MKSGRRETEIADSYYPIIRNFLDSYASIYHQDSLCSIVFHGSLDVQLTISHPKICLESFFPNLNDCFWLEFWGQGK